MFKKITPALVLTSLLFSLNSFAQQSSAPGDLPGCEDEVVRFKNTQIQVIGNPGTNRCFLTLSPISAYTKLIYRSFLFSNEGLFMIFDSYGPGPENETTAAREFTQIPHLFPRPQFEIINDQVIVTQTSGDKFTFDAETLEPISITNTQFTFNRIIDPTIKGGIEINSFKNGLWIEGGFKVGASPTSKRYNKSTIRNSKNQSCTVGNTELYNYTADGDNVWKFADDKAFYQFLNKKCPALK